MLLVSTLSPENQKTYKYYKHRLSIFAAWLTQEGRRWDEPTLLDYRAYLLSERGLTPATVNSHLSSIRTRYRTLLDEGTLQAAAGQLTAENLNLDERQAEVDGIIARVRAAVFSNDVRLEEETREVSYLRLKAAHIQELLNSPNSETLVGRRDRAVMVFLFTTGIREHELCALDVVDLYDNLEGYPALHVPDGRGCTERQIPYRLLGWGLGLVNAWLTDGHEITEGPVFRGFYKGGRVIRSTRLSVRAVEYILAAYPIEIDNQKISVRPMDLRRAYTRLLYEAGVELGDIKTNLGLTDNNALLDYIGGKEASLDLPYGADLLARRTWLRE